MDDGMSATTDDAYELRMTPRPPWGPPGADTDVSALRGTRTQGPGVRCPHPTSQADGPNPERASGGETADPATGSRLLRFSGSEAPAELTRHSRDPDPAPPPSPTLWPMSRERRAPGRADTAASRT